MPHLFANHSGDSSVYKPVFVPYLEDWLHLQIFVPSQPNLFSTVPFQFQVQGLSLLEVLSYSAYENESPLHPGYQWLYQVNTYR